MKSSWGSRQRPHEVAPSSIQTKNEGLKSLLKWRFLRIGATMRVFFHFVFFALSMASILSLSLSAPAFSQPVSPALTFSTHQNFVSDLEKRLTPVAVFGRDQRQRLPRKYKKLDQQIGLLHNPRTNTLCTAFCVGPDMIATASHCLFSHRKRRRLHLSSFLFKLNTARKNRPVYTRLAGSRARQTRRHIITGTSKLNRKPPIGAARDWAIVRLQRPGCRNGWLKTIELPHSKLQQAGRKKQLFQVAYHMDYRNWKIAYSRSCSVKRNYGGLTWPNIKKHFSKPQSLILHRCDTGEASSGSPLLMDSKEGPVVVGINVGTYQQREIVVRNGRVVRRTKYRTIANTTVSSSAFSTSISILKQATVIRGKADMKKLQLDLKERSHYHGAIDGIFGARTELAIKAFERGMNRPVTGLASRSLLAELTKIHSNPASIETSAGHETSSPAAAPEKR